MNVKSIRTAVVLVAPLAACVAVASPYAGYAQVIAADTLSVDSTVTDFAAHDVTMFPPHLHEIVPGAYPIDNDDDLASMARFNREPTPVYDAVAPYDTPSEESEPHSYPYVYTTGAPFPGDGAFFHFSIDPPPCHQEFIEIVPTALNWPNEPLGNVFAKILHAERYELLTELHDEPLGIQYISERPPLLIEWNERFLGPGELAPGIQIPTGAIWRPAFWVFGEFRTAIQHFDNVVANPLTEWANRLDLFGQLNLSGTERFVYGVRPLDKENSAGTGRCFVGSDFHTGGIGGGNWDTQTAFFEGDIGELLPFLDPYDYKLFDYGFSVGRMPLLAQQGLLINEDRIDAMTLTRNTLNGLGNLNLRMSALYAWDQVTRNSPIPGNPNRRDNNSNMFALLTESDFITRTVNVDFVYIDGDAVHGDMWAFGLSAIRRHHWHHNTYNTSCHVLGSFPINGETPYNQQGELLFAQTSWTPHHYNDLIYLNAFLAIDQFTSPSRGPLMGSPLGQSSGIVFAAIGLGRYGAPIAARTNNLAGAALGYQWFFDESRQQVIWEIGGVGETDGGPNRSQIASGLRYQKAIGQHFIFVLDGFVSKREAAPAAGAGGRTELRMKF